VELDAIFHQPGWTPLLEEEFRRQVAAIAATEGWVIVHARELRVTSQAPC
jgi:hypothetical protein